jgi:formamidopyrimidine-DNA glycosylase
MPELPEVQTVVTTLQPLVGLSFAGARVARKDVIGGHRASLASFVRQRRIRAIRREAKRILIDIDGQRTLLFHLGMTGQLVVTARNTSVADHTHLFLRLVDRDEELRFRDPRRFGGLWLLTPSTPRRGRGLGPVGLDPLDLQLSDFRQILARSRQVKALLLDQQHLGGLGNIYADESLFRSRIHPLTRANDLDAAQTRSLHRAMQGVLQSAIAAGGSTIRDYRTANGDSGWFQTQHKVYGREGQPCCRCRTPIERIQAAGRSSHVCPSCQPCPQYSEGE